MLKLKSVPEEPVQQQIDAAWEFVQTVPQTHDTMRGIYMVMLAAAPLVELELNTKKKEKDISEVPIAVDVNVSRLPGGFVREGIALAETCLLFGVPLCALSKDELLAAAAQGWKQYERHLEQSMENAKLMRDIRRGSL